MTPVRALLFRGADPYAGFDPRAHPVDLQGWNSEHHFFEPLIAHLRPRTILEIGTWKGASALYMARLCAALGVGAEIVCIDTWLGSSEHVLLDNYYASLRHRNGYPQIYYTFLANVVSQGMQDRITPFPIASEAAAVVLREKAVRAELIYIDAGHEYDAVYRDAAAFWPLLSDDGVMLFDDYGYSDVTRAACAFAAAQGKALYASYGKAFVSKGTLKPGMAVHGL